MKFHEVYLSRAQVADEYPISLRKLCQLHSANDLRAVLINGKAYYRRAEVDQYFLNLVQQAEQGYVAPIKRSGRPTKALEVAARKRLRGGEHVS